MSMGERIGLGLAGLLAIYVGVPSVVIGARRLKCRLFGHADALILPHRAIHWCARCGHETRATGAAPLPYTEWHVTYLRALGWSDATILDRFPALAPFLQKPE